MVFNPAATKRVLLTDGAGAFPEGKALRAFVRRPSYTRKELRPKSEVRLSSSGVWRGGLSLHPFFPPEERKDEVCSLKKQATNYPLLSLDGISLTAGKWERKYQWVYPLLIELDVLHRLGVLVHIERDPVEREIPEQDASEYVRLGDKPEVAAVLAVIAVIAHPEVIVILWGV